MKVNDLWVFLHQKHYIYFIVGPKLQDKLFQRIFKQKQLPICHEKK